MCGLDPKHVLALRPVRNRFHRMPGIAKVFSGVASRGTSEVFTLRPGAAKAKSAASHGRTSTRRCLQ